MAIKSRTPVQVVILRRPGHEDSQKYTETVRNAFDGQGVAGTYLDGALNTGVPVLVPEDPTQPHLRECLAPVFRAANYTVLVVLQPHERDPAPALRVPQKLGSAAHPVEALKHTLPEKAELGDEQGVAPSDRAREQDLQQPQLVLEVLRVVRRRLLSVVNLHKKRNRRLPKLFLSHAKIDGIPAALSLVNLINNLSFPSRDGKSRRVASRVYYDAVSLQPGQKWKEELKKHAAIAVMIAIRSEAYESRTWCRNEFIAAETHGMPIVVVDLRTRLQHEPERLPFGRATTVRVHDGNWLRVIMCALTADVRALRTEAFVATLLEGKPFEVLPHQPSELSLGGAYDRLAPRLQDEEKAYLIYPEPRLSGTHRVAAEAILKMKESRIVLLTSAELRRHVAG